MKQDNTQSRGSSHRVKAWAKYRDEVGGVEKELYSSIRHAFISGYDTEKEATDEYQAGHKDAERFYAVPSGIPSPEEMRRVWWDAYSESIRNRRGSHPTTAAEGQAAKEAGVAAVIELIEEFNKSKN